MKKTLATILTLLSVSNFAFILEPTEKPLPKVSGEIQDAAVDAILEGDLAAMKRLIRNGADPNFSYSGVTNIFHTISKSRTVTNRGLEYPRKFSEESLNVMRYLISLGVKTDRLSSLTGGGTTPLVWALTGVNYDYPHCRAGLIKVLLEGGADPDIGSRSSATYKVRSPFSSVSPFCGNEALDIYFSYKPNFLRGGCELPSNIQRSNQEVLDQHIGNGAKTPITALFEYFEKEGIPLPSLDGPYGSYSNPAWIEWEKRCP